jgi:hypothetical protein
MYEEWDFDMGVRYLVLKWLESKLELYMVIKIASIVEAIYIVPHF